jgi:hypothetical protein
VLVPDRREHAPRHVAARCGLDACRRIQQNTVEARLLNGRGLPNFGINFYVLNSRGEHAGVSMYPGASYAVCDEQGARSVPCEPLLEGAPGN